MAQLIYGYCNNAKYAAQSNQQNNLCLGDR